MQTEEYPKSGELSWLYTVLRNEALALLKKNNRLLPLDDSVAFDDGYEDELMGEPMPEPTETQPTDTHPTTWPPLMGDPVWVPEE